MTGKSEKKVEKEAESEVKAETEREEPKEPTLEKQLEKANAEAAANLDLAQRRLAELDNYRRRTEKEMADFKKFAAAGLISELINIPDDLEKALASANPEDPLAVGVKAIRNNLMKILESHGVTEVPTDKGFDPNMHEALMVVEGDEDNEIAQEYQKGYMINGRVLRTAKVVVTKKKEQEAAPEQDEKTAEQ